MALIRSVNIEDGEIILNLSITEEEYKLISGLKEVILVSEEFEDELTTGRLGNSNRIMLPKKILKKHEVELKGKVPAKIFEVGNKKFLLVKLEERKEGVPEFRE